MKEITEKLLEIESIKKYLEEKKIGPITILGLSDVSKSCISEVIQESEKRPMLIVTYNELQAQKLHKNIKQINKNAIYIPKKDIITYEYDAQSMDILYSRINTIISMYENQSELVICSIETLMQRVLSKKDMKKSILNLRLANEYNLEEIKQKLVDLGYERYDIVEGKGNFSVRGDILDIALDSKKGVRIEFFGDEIDQIRYFEISSQRSTENINQIKIYPLTEEVVKEPDGSILEYLQEDSLIVLDERNKIKLRSENILNDTKLAIEDLIERNKNVPYIMQNMYDIEKIFTDIEKFIFIELESQDIISKKENVIVVSYEDIQKIDDTFYKVTKQEKEKKPYVPRRGLSKDFREGEKVSFTDLKVRRLCCSQDDRYRTVYWSKYNKSRWNYKRLYQDKI